MSKYDSLVSLDAENAKRTFDTFYEFPSAINGNHMCFESTMELGGNLVASVTLSKFNYHVQFFDVWDMQTSHVIFTDNDPEENVQFFNTALFASDENALLMYPSIDDVQDSDLEHLGLTRENFIVLYNLHNELLKILKKDETIQKVVL
jgi:hypothetical protein